MKNLLRTSSAPWWTRPVSLVLAGVVAAVVAFAAYGVVVPGGVNAEASASARSQVARGHDDHGSVDAALKHPEPVLPSGMPTARPRLGKLLDPLSPAEVGYARALAVRKQKATGKRVDGTPGYQFIGAELAPGAEYARSRIVQVLSFDYAASHAVTQLVTLATGKVVEKYTPGMQPPPSKRESAYAMDLLVHSSGGADLRARFEKATGKQLVSADQLNFHAGAYSSGGAGGDADVCGVHRCLTFQGAADAGDWLYFGNLAVDLTDGLVRTIS